MGRARRRQGKHCSYSVYSEHPRAANSERLFLQSYPNTDYRVARRHHCQCSQIRYRQNPSKTEEHIANSDIADVAEDNEVVLRTISIQ